MSRLSRYPIIIPDGVKVALTPVGIVVNGPKGNLERNLRGEVKVSIDANKVVLDKQSTSLFAKKLIGTYASHIKNMIEGVTNGFKKELKVEGIGYRADMNGDNLQLKVGFSHLVDVEVPGGLTLTVKSNVITIEGHDKEKVSSFAAYVRSIKKPEPYKGKGIRYIDEVVRRKQGKRSV